MEDHIHAPSRHHHSEGGHHHGKSPAFSKFPQLESWLEDVGQKLPQLPHLWRENIAKYGPWVTLVILVLSLPAVLALFGLSTFVFTAATKVGYYHHGGFDIFILLLVAVSLVFEALALPGLFKRAKQGWVFIFYASLITVVSNVLSFNIGALVGSAISLYIIFQIKSLYNK